MNRNKKNTRILLKDVKKDPHENWQHYKYEDYNKCPICNGKIHMTGSINEKQFFKCLK